MNAIKSYGNIITKNLSDSKKALAYLKLGLNIAGVYLSLFPDRKVPASLQFLQKICVNSIKDYFNHPDNSMWVNIFSPTEILHAMGVNPLFIEAYSGFLAGISIEGQLIDAAEAAGISNSLCSFHKVFLGSGELNLLKKCKMSITTSMICDGNIGTFRYLSEKYQTPLYILDIPYEYNKENVNYVKNQLQEMIRNIEEIFGRKLDMDRLKEVIARENQSKELLKKYLENLALKNLSTSMTYELYMLFASHVFLGREETLSFYRMLLEDIQRAPDRRGKGIFFIHVPPLFEKNFIKYFNFSPEFSILGFDLNYDFLDEIELRDPLEGIARKLLLNSYNGSFDRKIALIDMLMEKTRPDGVIHFCHFGCKQALGGIYLLQRYFREKNIPFLTLDGDVIDKKNNQEGQTKTRLEAFLEIIRNR
ncbi:MAG: 2-hydroxyacyl-CoA dehydratase [Firmicutes bacterium]|nr:2-hydroxyacyl-CoA dehydratase [Bacillota bacterium]